MAVGLRETGLFAKCVWGRKVTNKVMRRFTTGIRSEKCVVRQFRRRANVYLQKT